MKLIDRLLYKSSQEWQIAPGTARFFFWAPIVVSIALIFTRAYKPLYRFLLDEDGLFEWATFLCFALAAVAGLALTKNRWQAGSRPYALLYLLFAVAMVFSAGEEVSWGQRVLEFETPEALLEINKQDEFTLHNIGEALDAFKLIMLIAGAYGAAAFIVNQRLRIERYLDKAEILVVPPFFFASAFGLVFVYRVFRLVVWQEAGFTITNYGEWIEFLLAFGLLGFSSLARWRLTAQPAALREVEAEPKLVF